MQHSLIVLITFTSSRYPTAELILPHSVLRASRQMYGSQWYRDSDNLSVFDGLCQSLSFKWRETAVLSLLHLKQPHSDHTLHEPHTKQSWYFKQISSYRGGEADIFSLKWSYHSGCRPTGKPDSYSPLRHRVASLCLLLLMIDRQDRHATLLFFYS